MSAQRSRSRKKQAPPATQPPTIYDGERYFDATFTEDEMRELDARILAECGFANDHHGRNWLFCEVIRLGGELGAALGTGYLGHHKVAIHMCRELEIDYKSFAKNVPKLPIEPFYQFVASRFPRLKPTSNKLRLNAQQQHMHTAFIDWIDAECERTACPKSYHGFGCEDRYEEPDYAIAVQRVWKHNATRPKLTLVHSA